MKHAALFLCLFTSLWIGSSGAAPPRNPPGPWSLRGVARDESSGVIPGAVIELRSKGSTRRVETGVDGEYHLYGLTPGVYALRAEHQGFDAFLQPDVRIGVGAPAVLDFVLRVATQREDLTVSADPDELSITDSAANANALVLNGRNLDTLPDDPNDLLADLLALAGASASSGPPQILVDGFSGGRLPPKQAIREIRINQNPFSAEYDRMGLGRIEVDTKPGEDNLHGTLSFKAGDAAMNSRNPYSQIRPPYESRQIDGDVGTRLTQRASIYADFERGDVQDNAVIQARILNPSLTITPFTAGILDPSHWTTAAARADYQLSESQSLTMRYEWFGSAERNAGVGIFALPSQGRREHRERDRAQIVHTAVLSPQAVNEIRFQFGVDRSSSSGDSSKPTVRVLGAFIGGGSPAGNEWQTANRYEAQNMTSLSLGANTLRFGLRVRGASVKDYSTRNFNGEYVFSGGFVPGATAHTSSIERYRRTLFYLNQGLPMDQVTALGGGASQFSISSGNPHAALHVADLGLFVQDDWRVKPNLTLNAGMRYEVQSNVHHWADLAPRIGVAWMPGAKRPSKALTVIRAGSGFFYDRVSDDVALEAQRFNGSTARQYVVSNPSFFPEIPSLQQIQAAGLPETLRRMDGSLRAPYFLQSSIGIERRLPFRIIVSSTFLDTRGTHLLRSRNINAPLLGGAGPRPFPGGDIYSYESAGILRQRQWITTVNRRFNNRFSLFASYTANTVKSDTEGANFFPSNPYNARADFGRASTDIRHRVHAGGVLAGPFGWTLSPFLVARSGVPFDIVTGLDPFGDSQFNHRPSFAAGPGAIATRFGVFNINPLFLQASIPRNYATGSALLGLNLRLSKTFSFGAKSGPSPTLGMEGGARHEDYGVGRYSLTFSIIARNALNNVNPGTPTGNLSSPMFGISTWLAALNDAGQAAQGDNRRIQLQLRLRF